MDCLEINIHQLILSDLAANIGATKENVYDPTISNAIAVVASKVQIIDDSDEGAWEAEENKVFMPASRVQCHIGFGELAISLPNSHIASTVTVLVDMLQDIPSIQFDQTLSWEDWALPDQLTFTTVTALLHMANRHSEYRKSSTVAIIDFISTIVGKLEKAKSADVLSYYAPAFHGLYRALISTSFPWTLDEWAQLSTHFSSLYASEIIERLNRLLVDILQHESEDEEVVHFIQAHLSRYVSNGRPLTGYFIVCCVTEVQWTVLAQALISPVQKKVLIAQEIQEAEAANKAWASMLRGPVELRSSLSTNVIQAMQRTAENSMEVFSDLLSQIDEMDQEPAVDTYAWETMSESLKLASVCSAALQELDEALFARLKLLLSVESPISDSLVQEAALKSTIILVHNFPAIAASMISHLRRFVTAPLPIFEMEFASESRASPPLSTAAKCLALCITVAPGDDLIMSNMYSLLNFIAATNKNMQDSSTSSHFTEPGLRGLGEEDKRLVGISTISVATKLALEFRIDEVTRLTVSMLLQRLRSAEPRLEAAIAYNLVDLALSAPVTSFSEIVRAFSAINRSANPDDPRFSNNMVLAAQTRLAQEMHRRPELGLTYLIELLTLFSDKGVAIQNIASSNEHVKIDDMVEQLSSLLLPIDALLAHNLFDPRAHTELPPEVVPLFRNMWFLCVLFHFTSVNDKAGSATEWRRPALLRIAVKTPSIVLEESRDSLFGDIEYNAVIRQEYAQLVITKHRNLLNSYISLRASEIRYLSSGQVVFLLAMHDMETMRAAAGRPSPLVSYFVNESLNKHVGLSACMDAIAEKVIRGAITDLNLQASEQALPEDLSAELRELLVLSTHRIEKARETAFKFLNRLLTSFPSLMCDPPLVLAILEVLTLMSRSCEDEYTDEYNPLYEFYSERANITLRLTDNWKVRNDILAQLQRASQNWFELALGRAPVELQSTLQRYLAMSQSISITDSANLGASVAERFGKAVSPGERQLISLSSLASWKLDHAQTHVSQLTAKAYFAGEVAGSRAAKSQGVREDERLLVSVAESEDIRTAMGQSLRGIREKTSSLTVNDLRKLLLRCSAFLASQDKPDYRLMHYLVALPFQVFTPISITAGIETWTWLIAERPELEISLMVEICSGWVTTIKQGRGIFSKSLNYDDPFYHHVDYSPTNNEDIDRANVLARRRLAPHGVILQMLFSRLQAARYRKPGIMRLLQRLILRSAKSCSVMSTHALSRESRFSFLLFGFELLRGLHLDSFCEQALRDSLYACAFSWFAVRPQWSFGSSRVQFDADVKVLSEFLSYLQTDTYKGFPAISSLASNQNQSRTTGYLDQLKHRNQLLRVLVEDEIYRVGVWANPMNDAKRGTDHVVTTDRSMTEPIWMAALQTAWQLDPAIAIFLTERCKHAVVHNEVGRLVRSNTRDVIDIPEALRFLLGEVNVRRDLKHLLLWAPVPPVFAITCFQQRDNKDPLVLQYAHRVLEQHPVDLTFFFVPQIVQALRYDELGYVSHFVFETAKISQLFCHQIVWNMKANCYKDDAGEMEDSLKPKLDELTDMVISSLSGEAKAFYEREFGFFNEVTSISGKLRPFIKKTKPEKKAKIDEEMAKIVVEVGVYLPSNPDGKVIDVDRKSGRPLQSHAKAPFMATFKVRKERVVIKESADALVDVDGVASSAIEYDAWLQAIFKVGDDCRQDVLALQIIAMFKNIFLGVGLPLYLFPYRVTATAPGCGVIDVVPNATSRDEMGRAKVNDLLGFFVSKFGGEETITFQKARLNFIQSMAAYSVACYILQIKDRHNGNIMIDGEGHIVHVDFGFLFDIGPGGVKFEPSSFKLTHEMVVLMGGRYSQGYALFQQLTVKAFLALRPHTDQLVSTVQLMLDSGLPSFKGEGTIKRLKDRFAPGLNERQAAEWMVSIVRNAHENVRSTAYDEFQRLQNGIPYK